MRNPIVGLALALCVLTPSAQARQIDPTNPETQFRALIVFSEKGKACLNASPTETYAATTMSLSMAANAGEAARTYRSEFALQAAASSCQTQGVIPLATLGQKLAKPVAQGYLLAFLDQPGFCPASALAADARLLALVRKQEIDASDPDVADARETMKSFLAEACAGDWEQMGAAYSFAGAARSELTQAVAFSCWRDSYLTQAMFECVYGEDAFRDNRRPDSAAFARYQVRAALAKASAFEIDRTHACKVFTAAETVVGAAQMRIDAAAASEFARQSRTRAANLDPDIRHADAETVLTAGAAAAAGLGCDALDEQARPELTPNTPLAERGELSAAWMGAKRIHETLDRMALLVVSLPQCKALPNFEKTKAAAEAHIASWPVERRHQVADQLSRPAERIDEYGCDAAKLGAQWAVSPLVALDALAGKWN